MVFLRSKRYLLKIFLHLFMMMIFYSCSSSDGSGVDELLNIKPDPIDNGNGVGDGGVGNSALVFTPSAFDFGDVGVSGSGSRVFTVTNSSDKVVYFSAFNGANATFSINQTTCSGALTPNQSCSVEFLFTPSSGGIHTITINARYGLSSGDTSLIAPLGLQGSAGANAPSNFQLTNISSTQASISWQDNSNNETGFEVQRCDGLTCSANFVSAFSEVINSNTTQYSFLNLVDGSYYRFRVRAITASSNSAWLDSSTYLTFGGISSITDNGTGQSDISNIDCRSAGDGTYVSLSWNAIADATNYFILRRENGANTLLKTVSAPASSTILTGLNTNEEYELLVTAATSGGFNSLNTQVTTLTTSDYLPCIVIGKANPASMTSDRGFNSPSGMTYYDNRYFLADRYNHRVLIWNQAPTDPDDVPDIVLGQSDLVSNYSNNTPNAIGTVSASSLREPIAVWAGLIGGQEKLLVADYQNHRVLVWNSIPTQNHQAADVVIGQASLTTAIADANDITRGLQNPIAVTSDGTRVYIADYLNHRVLIYNSLPTFNFATPDVYLGQDSSTGQAQNCGANRMSAPRGVWSDGTRLLVTNTGCHRVSLYEAIPAAGNPNPSTILGNTSLTATGANAAATRVNTPCDIAMHGGRIYVADNGNHRIKVWNSIPAAGNHGVASDYVIGASDTAAAAGTNQFRLRNPVSFATDGTNFYVADSGNHRLMRYTSIPTVTNSPAQNVIGQENFDTLVFNYHAPLNNNNFDYPQGIAFDGNQFFVADPQRHRVLVWNGIPTRFNQPADFVIGQVNFQNMIPGRSIFQLNQPRGICTGDDKLWVPDYDNRRVMVFNLPITTNAPNASGVLGQTSFTTNTSNTGLDRVNQAISCHHDGTRLFVTDYTYKRILIWDNAPIMTGPLENPAADVRVGENAGNGTSQTRLRDPWGVFSDGDVLYVADSGNHRIMIWDPIPTVHDAPATYRLGGGATWATNTAGVSPILLNFPTDVVGDGNGRIYVLDSTNGRIMVYNNITGNDPADDLYGKPNFTTNIYTADDHLGLSNVSRGLFLRENRIFFGDINHSRVIGIPLRP